MMNVDKPRNTTNGCTHQLSALRVCPNPTRDNGTSIWDIGPPHAFVFIVELLSSPTLTAANKSGSHNTAKLTIVVPGNAIHAAVTAGTRQGTSANVCAVDSIALWYSLRDRGIKAGQSTRRKRAMSTGREIRSYDYVNHPYERVRDALRKNALTVFQEATKAAASRAQSVAAELHVDFGGIGVKTDINISVKSIEEKFVDATSTPTTQLLLEWEASTAPRLFPLMKGDLSVYPLTSTETQLDFSGVYEPPFGAVGRAMNAVAGHRIAEASVHRFISDVAGHLRHVLG